METIEVAVIGGGQSGLAIGYYLKQRGIPFVVLDANPRIGDAWRNRWDTLRLFSQARHDELPGMPFPARGTAFPTKDEMADYLERYAAAFQLPVEIGVRVDRLLRRGDAFCIRAGQRTIEARQVVVAMGAYQQPVVPRFAAELEHEIVQLHSSEYRNPSQLRDGTVLVVGAGNSGAEIAMDLARQGRSVVLAGRKVLELPFDIASPIGLHVLQPLVARFIFHRVLTLDTPMGRRAAAGIHARTAPLIRVKSKALAAAGVTRVPRVAGTEHGHPVLENGETIAARNVIWCTGFAPGFSWIELPVLDAHGHPIQQRGVVASEPGLYFLGLPFTYAMSSAMIHGLARDANYLAAAIACRVSERAGTLERWSA